MASSDIWFKFLGDAKDLDAASRKAQRSLDQTESKSKKTDRAFGNLNRTIGGFVAAVGAAEIGRFALDAAQMAQEAEAAAASAEKVLGGSLETLRTNLDGTREALGLNSLELDQVAAKFGLLTEGMNLTDEAQSAFIEKLIRTGGDLAAFRGDVESAPEAIDAFGAALRGEFDPLEQFGVKLSEAAIKEKEVELAADPLNEALSDQELRILAIQELIDEKAAPALGSLDEAMADGRTSAEELNTKLEDMKIRLGDKLAPALEATLGFLLDTIDSWDRLVENFSDTRLGAFMDDLDAWLENTLGPFRDMLVSISGWLDQVTGNAGKASSAIKGAKEDAGGSFGGGRGFAKGGTIPGPKGMPMWVRAHGGEKITNPDMDTGTGGGINIYVQTGVGDPNEIGRTIVDYLRRYESANGALPVTVRSVAT